MSSQRSDWRERLRANPSRMEQELAIRLQDSGTKCPLLERLEYGWQITPRSHLFQVKDNDGISVPFCPFRNLSSGKFDELTGLGLERPDCNIDRQLERVAPLQISIVGSLIYHPVILALA